MKQMGRISLIALIALAGSLALFVTPQGSNVSPDSVLYLNAAGNWAAGDGLTLTIDGSRSSTAIFLPLFPFLVGVIASLGIEPVQASRIVTVVSLSLAMIPVYLLARMAGGALMAALTGLFSSISYVLLIVTSFAWTEATYILLIYSAFYALARYWQAEKKSDASRWLVVSAGFVAAAWFTRYVAAILVLTGVLVILFKEWRDPRRHLLGRMILFGAISSLAPTIWLFVNSSTAGKLAERPWSVGGRSQLSLLDYVLQTLQTIFNAFVITPTLNLGVMSSVRSILRQPTALMLIAAVMLFVVSAVLWHLRRDWRPPQWNSLSPAFWIPALYVIPHLALHTFLPWLGRLSAIEQRYLSPTYPYLWMVTAAMVLYVLRSLGRWSRSVQLTASGGAVLVAVFLLLGQWQFIVQLRNTPPAFAFNAPEWRNHPAITYLAEKANASSRVYSNQAGLAIHFLLDAPALSLYQLQANGCTTENAFPQTAYIAWFPTVDDPVPPDEVCCAANSRVDFADAFVCEVRWQSQ